MKKLILAAIALCFATAIVVQAQDAAPKKQHKLTAEQKQVQADMLAKYDTNKDGKLDKTEKAAMTPEDKATWAKAFPKPGKKKAAEGSATDTSTNAPAVK